MRTRPSAPIEEEVNVVEKAPIPTPPSVQDVTPSLCLSLVEFKDMLRQFRAVDDSVTLRLNREFAHSRDRGTSVPPSLLMQHSKSFSSSTATDVGRSTYSSVSEPMEDTIKYCMEVNAQHAQQAQAAQAPRNKDDMLDLDRVQAQSALTAEIPRSRGESMGEFMERQFRNELVVESIVRRRSLEGGYPRLTLSVPIPLQNVPARRSC